MSWLELLRTEARATSITAAAQRLGVSRTAVSLCLAERYPASTEHIEAKVWDALGQIECPALDKTINATECRTYRERSAPTHNPMAMQYWKACQHCPHNPNCAQRKEVAHAQLH